MTVECCRQCVKLQHALDEVKDERRKLRVCLTVVMQMLERAPQIPRQSAKLIIDVILTALGVDK